MRLRESATLGVSRRLSKQRLVFLAASGHPGAARVPVTAGWFEILEFYAPISVHRIPRSLPRLRVGAGDAAFEPVCGRNLGPVDRWRSMRRGFPPEIRPPWSAVHKERTATLRRHRGSARSEVPR